MKKNNKATKVTDLILRTVWSNQKIAEKVGCTVSYVWTVRKKMEGAAPPEEPVLELTEVVETSDIDAILDERGGRYGSFMGHAHITIALKQILHNKIASRDLHLFPDQLEALDMICHKLGRIANGDPNYVDSWIDIAGYATLVADRLGRKVR